MLLIEAGGSNEDPSLRVAGERNTFWATGGLKIDRGYVTEPQEALEQRKLPYHRGTGLGGSSATNIGVWDYGCKPDMNEWANRVGDDWWKWENVQARIREVCKPVYWNCETVSANQELFASSKTFTI